jgi:hypothetical protein
MTISSFNPVAWELDWEVSIDPDLVESSLDSSAEWLDVHIPLHAANDVDVEERFNLKHIPAAD